MNKLLTILIIFLFFQGQSNLIAQNSDCCDRHAILNSCTSNDPMNIIGSNDTYCRSIRIRLTELMTEECFHFLNTEIVDSYRQRANEEGWGELVKPSNVPNHEYSFDTDFISGLDEYREEDGRPVRSRLTVKMFFEGEQRELVHQWETQGTWDTISDSGTGWSGHGNKLRNRYREGQDIIEIMERFEKLPVDLKIEPDKSEVNVGEIIEFNLTDFRDVFGEDSREFNRIVVHAYEGEIINGEASNIGPDYKVFKLNESITVKYQAPTDCDTSTDRLTIYSSCDILPSSRTPIEETNIKERIIEKEFSIQCYDASITVTKKFEKILETSNEDRKEEHIQKHRLNESIEATVTVYAKLTDVQEMPVFNQTWEYYKPVSVNITSFNYNSTENKLRSGPNYQTTVNYFRSVNNFEIEELNSVSQVPWMLAIDNETGKAVKIIPGGYDIAYDFIETETVKNVKTSEQGTEIDSNSSTKNSEKTFALGPVGEEVEDPTIKKSDTWIQDYIKKQGIALPPGVEIPEISNQETIKKIKPDILVKSGDGKYNFGGYGKRTIKEDLWNGYQEENLNYKWSMTRMKK